MRPTKILITLLVAVFLLWGLEAVVAAQEGSKGWAATPPGGYPMNYGQIMDPSQGPWRTPAGAAAPTGTKGWAYTPPGGYPMSYYQIMDTTQAGWQKMGK